MRLHDYKYNQSLAGSAVIVFVKIVTASPFVRDNFVLLLKLFEGDVQTGRLLLLDSPQAMLSFDLTLAEDGVLLDVFGGRWGEVVRGDDFKFDFGVLVVDGVLFYGLHFGGFVGVERAQRGFGVE